MDDLISRQAAIVECNKRGAEHVGYAIAHLPSAYPEQPTGVQDILQYLDEYLHPIVSPDHWSVYSELYDMVSMLPSAQPDRSLWFRIGEICVDESKGFISSGRAVEKIRELLREAERRKE